MISLAQTAAALPGRGLAFFQRQQRDWKVTVARTSLDKFLYQMVLPYLSVYIVALGAGASELGMVISAGMVVAGALSPFIGWFIDRTGPKRLYLLGIGILAASYLLYGVAPDWRLTIAAMVAYWLGNTMSTQSCATVCGNCLANRDRATGMLICESVTAGVLGMAGPIVGAWLVQRFGGVNPAGIRPLFFICLVGTAGTFTIVYTQLSNRRWGMARRGPPDMLGDLREVLTGSDNLKRWLVLASVGQLPMGMVLPFATVYAFQFKGADAVVLGAMVTATALTSVLFGIPLGRVADRLGRKRVLYVMSPLFWLSIPLLLWAPHPAVLVAAGILQGFFYISMPIAGAMERELVPPEQMGRWLGIARFFKMVVLAALTFISGFVWDQAGPAYVFFAVVVFDALIRMPLLAAMPETLRLRQDGEALRG